MQPETDCCTTSAPLPGSPYYGAKSMRVYPATLDDMRQRRDTLRSHQQAVATKIELLTQLIALFED